MDSLITAAAQALAAGDPLGALDRVALRDDAPALALRGIAMAQLGDLLRAKALVRRAARAFGPKEAVARARCVVAEAEIALASRELGWPVKALDAARVTLMSHGDAINAAHARYLQIRRLLLIGQLDEAQALLADLDPATLPPALRATHELVVAGIAMRCLQSQVARAALVRAELAARQSGIAALCAEVDSAARMLDSPAARLICQGEARPLLLDDVQVLLASASLVVDGCRSVVRGAGMSVSLATRPILFTLVRTLAEAWPTDVSRETLIAKAFRLKLSDESHRARLRVEIGRLRAALKPLASVIASKRGFALVTRVSTDVVLLMPPVEARHAAVFALLADGESWSSSALALALGNSQRSVQRALDTLATAGNRLGIIESESTLTITAASLDNHNGQLRALGSNGKTSFTIGGLFDNRNGTVESANNDLTLGAGGLLNVGGNVLHVGTGIFDIATGLLGSAGGNFVTRAGLTLTADGWTNSSVIQADRLTVNINSLNQTASGQLLAVSTLTGNGGNWNNDGLIASDDSLSLTLGGTYSGNGRVSSLGTFGLSAAQLNVSAAASIAGGGDTTVSVGGQLNNAGRLTSAANLTVNAGGLYNTGTLGSGQGLTVTTGSVVNDHGLIFSGGNMSLRVNALNNSYANIYSLGNLTIDRNGQGAQADSIVNSSASIQSDGSMSLAASTIQNIRAVLTTSNQGIYTAKIDEITCIEGVNAGDCSGKQNHAWEIVQRDKFEVTEASAASSITAGGNLALSGGDLLNQSSTIATGGNLSASLVNLTNSGIETGETETTRVFRSERTRNASGWYSAASNFTDKYWFESAGYNPNDLGGLEAGLANFIGMTEMEYPNLGSSTKIASSDQSYAAVIQAAGAVNINAQNNIDNSVVRPGYTYVGSGPRTGTGASGSQFSTRITLNQQLPPDLAQQQVNPVSLPGFSLPTSQNGLFRLSQESSTTPTGTGPQSWTLTGATVTSSTSTPVTINRVKGLPSNAGRSQPHKYLIETNPVLTDLKQFMSSDYLLSNLGYDPDQSAKRLGDGLYEQRLIQQAVVARTGQRFIDGQTSDEGLFKYLMNNAIASKTELNLSLGVSLTSEQVAALTHDIVWMENAEVNGEQVLVPVLYLANANNRLAANGALIQGSDVTLIAGKDLNNAGTLRASNNLSATAGNDLVNSGLVEAGNRLDLLAGNNLTNKAGGIIAGRDVSVAATRGDVINERTVTTHESSSGYRSERTDFVDNAARIEAANSLTINAGRDVNNVGGVVKSGADTTITAGRDVNLTSAEQIVSGERGRHRDQTVTQYGSDVDVGRDLKVNAGRDITAIASQIEAKRDVSMSAVGDLTLASAADEQHSYSKTKKVTSQEDHVSQVSTTLTAGGSIALSAGQDLTLISSKVKAGSEAYLVAGDKLELLAAQDSDYSLYDMKKKGSFGSSKTQRDEVTDVKNIGSEIKSGGDLTLVSGGDQRYQGAKLNSGNDLTLESGGSITFEAVKDLHQESHEKSSSNLAWQSAKGKGNTDETLRQSTLEHQGQLAIKAADGLKIDIKQIDQKSVSQTIDSMVQADPSLAWLKEAEQRGDVNWQLVKELHDSFKYSNSGLGAGAQLAIAIVMAAFVGPAALGALGGAGAVAAGGAAIATGAATTATVSFINNGGDLGAVFKDVTSSDALKGYAISGITAGITAGYFNDLTGTTTDLNGKINVDLGSLKGIGQFAAKQALQNGTSTALGKIMGQGGDLGDALQSTLFNTLAAASFNAVGDYTKDLYADGSLQKIAIHAMVGGLLAQVSGGDFRTGALAAGANEAMVDQLNTLVSGDQNLLNMSSQLVGMLAAATQSDVDADSLQKGAWVAQNATQYNYLNHDQLAEAAKELRACANATCREEMVARYKDLSFAQDLEAAAACSASPASCAAYSKEVANTMANLDDIYQTLGDGPTQEWETLRQSNLGFQDMLATFTAGHTSASIAEAMQQKWGLSDEETKVVAENLVLVAGGGVAAIVAKKALSAVKAKSDEGAKVTPPKTQASTGAIVDNEAGGFSYYDQFKKADGSWDWPKEFGFSGNPVKNTLPVGTKLDRYGGPEGSFLSPQGVPFDQRALAPGSRAGGYYQYEVLKPLPVVQGEIAPAFGQPGGGTQILPDLSERFNVDRLVKEGYLRRTN